ncbi:MAG TPA: TRAM domain-containing protein [Candidatus Syntrophoarchaeum butanivorans]|uniref:Deoxyribonuclease/rho motif-related TRAM domain protein n=1 Tax=Candidatus Syntropharchaeum butanivorans TaxID=1839936 RepID=A0A1F2P5G7_9EURY|nr:MAG: Deoxyribonuclease/rho motif-related TRAM domain protein [Candidatus Syntrophoarchaeum butanivorans]HEC57534.1 TRAM domain-containing protein [Candidatus Syntrophoarchaeum butanivorans]
MNFGSPSGRYVRNSPVDEGDVLDVKIESIGREGDGIAKVEGFVIFVPQTKVGDEVRIRVMKVTSKVAFGEILG